MKEISRRRQNKERIHIRILSPYSSKFYPIRVGELFFFQIAVNIETLMSVIQVGRILGGKVKENLN
jgi:hypothetical protein